MSVRLSILEKFIEGDVRDSLDIEKGVAQPEEDVFLRHSDICAKYFKLDFM
jgi:hypothetical protein